MPVDDGSTNLPILTDSEGNVSGSSNGACVMTQDDYGMLKLHALNGAQRQADGASLYAENLRYDYLRGKDNQSIAQGLGYRVVTESGSGRTRAEANRPAATSAADPVS